ncbi:hypothetical protein [Xenorhabdus ishibashii]|uniref:Uncharacterized protein n=1 Tax=Xenorhabdus ishibashii TaxID=1034471 RepID=A0A2D0KE27_9GAMM|nr:hypothetical protein [Xenorhabdus ishibashii]PHM61681.1 hypothetical protein Xish_00820 [Xenorhabdus ishibashii]
MIVWVNSRWLDYAQVYNQRTGYLHALLITGIRNDGSAVHVVDSLIVDRTPWACNAWLQAHAFEKAISERVRSETHDHMGVFWILRLTGDLPEPGTKDALIRQAKQFLSHTRYYEAVKQYKEDNIVLLIRKDAMAAKAARRIFDHISVLYILPGLKLLENSLELENFDVDTRDSVQSLRRAWHALSIMALKYEATFSVSILERMLVRFDEINNQTKLLWGKIAAH